MGLRSVKGRFIRQGHVILGSRSVGLDLSMVVAGPVDWCGDWVLRFRCRERWRGLEIEVIAVRRIVALRPSVYEAEAHVRN